jgi:2'-5' RNA ligase
LHLTLKFLGDVSQSRIDRILPILRDISEQFSPFEIQFEQIGCFPNLSKARVIYWEVTESSGQLRQLNAMIETQLFSLGFAKERQRFKPHLTLGRIREQTQSPLLMIEIAALPLPVQIKEMHLMKSELSPAGSRYTIRESFSFTTR